MNGAGGCDEVFEGETAMDIPKQSSKHFMSSTDEAHKPMERHDGIESQRRRTEEMVGLVQRRVEQESRGLVFI